MAIDRVPMQVNVQKLSPVLIEFAVEVEPDRVKAELDKAYNTLAKTARVRGFRPGKAPRKILAQMFGPRVAADVAQKLVEETWPQALSDQKVNPINEPSFEPATEVKRNAAFSYKARFEVVPTIDAVEYDGLAAKRQKQEVTDEDIDREIDHLRSHSATLEPLKEDRAAAEGDIATIGFQVSVKGKPVEDAGAEDFQVEIGSGNVLKEIESGLVGKKPGDKVAVDIALPAQHPHPKLKGQTATFDIELKELKERVLPEVDDELAKDIDEAFETLDDLKKSIREQLEKSMAEQAENNLAEQLVLELCKKNPIPVPPSLVQRQAQLTEREVLGQARARGQTGNIGDDLKNRILQDSEIKVRAGLLMAEIAKAEGLQIGDEQIEEGLKELAEQSGKNVAKLRAEYRDKQKREMLVGMILENKVLDIIEAKAKIEDASGDSSAAEDEDKQEADAKDEAEAKSDEKSES